MQSVPPLVLTEEQQSIVIQQLIAEKISLSCPLDMKKNLDNEIFKLESGVLRSLTQTHFGNAKKAEIGRCLVNSIVNPSTEGIIGARRFDSFVNYIQQLGKGVSSAAYGVNLSRHGNFSDIDPSGNVIAKISNETTGKDDMMRECVVGNILNEMREITPIFSQVYGLVACDAYFENGKLCNMEGKTPVLLMEKIKGITFAKWLENAKDKNTLDDAYRYLFILMIVFSGLYFANARYGFVHKDLHPENIMVRELEEEVYVPIILGTETIMIKTDTIPAIIDYGYSTINVEVPRYILESIGISINDPRLASRDKVKVAVGTRNFDDSTRSFTNYMGSAYQNPIFDYFRAVATPYFKLGNKIKVMYDTYFMAMIPDPFSVDVSDDAKSWSEKFFQLSFQGVEVLEKRGITLPYILNTLFTQMREDFPNFIIIPDEITDFSPRVLTCSNFIQNHFMKYHPELIPKLNFQCDMSFSAAVEELNQSRGEKNLDVNFIYDYFRSTGRAHLFPNEQKYLQNAITEGRKTLKSMRLSNLDRYITAGDTFEYYVDLMKYIKTVVSISGLAATYSISDWNPMDYVQNVRIYVPKLILKVDGFLQQYQSKIGKPPHLIQSNELSEFDYDELKKLIGMRIDLTNVNSGVNQY